jgi:hypothetical protein
MASNRMRRRIERLLDQADAAADQHDWESVRRLANDVLLIDDANEDAIAFVRLADSGSSSANDNESPGHTGRCHIHIERNNVRFRA